jgi:hypothetical protein
VTGWASRLVLWLKMASAPSKVAHFGDLVWKSISSIVFGIPSH